MEQLSQPSTTAVGLYQPGDITAETVISELNMFRGTTTLPTWDTTSSHCPPPTYTQTNTQSSGEASISDPLTADSGHRNAAGPSGLHNGRQESSLPYPLTPPTSTPDSGSKSTSEEREVEAQPPQRKKRTPIPDNKKDSKYWERRRKNNVAAKRSREQRRKKLEGELQSAKDAITENVKLKQEIEVLKSEINSLRRLLRDANMTLSLWIRAKQASEPNAQLPPMLRSPNVSFVNFPASSTI